MKPKMPGAINTETAEVEIPAGIYDTGGQEQEGYTKLGLMILIVPRLMTKHLVERYFSDEIKLSLLEGAVYFILTQLQYWHLECKKFNSQLELPLNIVVP